MATGDPYARWYSRLSRKGQLRVLAWLEDHPPPAAWTSSKLAWAYTEMPFAPLPRKI